MRKCHESVRKVVELTIKQCNHAIIFSQFGPSWAILNKQYTMCQLFVFHCTQYLAPAWPQWWFCWLFISNWKSQINRSAGHPAWPSYGCGLRHLKVLTCGPRIISVWPDVIWCYLMASSVTYDIPHYDMTIFEVSRGIQNKLPFIFILWETYDTHLFACGGSA